MTGRAESAGKWGGWRRHVVERTVCLGFLIHPSDSNLWNNHQKDSFNYPVLGFHTPVDNKTTGESSCVISESLNKFT